jgi:exodeoxyribonuclease III
MLIILYIFCLSFTVMKHSGLVKSLSIMSWNVNGLRSFTKHDSTGSVLASLINRHKVDVLCLQETKLQTSHVPEMDLYLKSQHKNIQSIFWSCSTARKGYSGTATVLFDHSKSFKIDNIQATYGIGDAEGDVEGRVVTVESDVFTVVNSYSPNVGGELKRLPYRTTQWDSQLAHHIRSLKARRPHVPVILTGDLNVAHSPLDYHNARDRRTLLQPGTTPQEQASFGTHFLQGCGLLDTFRTLHPAEQVYSYFSARAGPRGRAEKKGMRLDYVLLAPPTPIPNPTSNPTGSATAASDESTKLSGVTAYIEDEVRTTCFLMSNFLLSFGTSRCPATYLIFFF